MFLAHATAASVTVHLRPARHSEACDLRFPLVQGMGFVTAFYSSLVPLFKSAVGFRSITPVHIARNGLQKFRIEFDDATIWLLYALPAHHHSEKLALRLLHSKHCEALGPFSGALQLAKCPSPACEKLYDRCAGAYATGVGYSGSLKGTYAQYSFAFERGGAPDVPLLMFALPHHVASFNAQTAQGVQTFFQLQTTTKGVATAVLGDSWTMVEERAPVDLASAPLRSAPWSIDEQRRNKILDAAMVELQQDMGAATNLDSMYFSGKAMDKYAQLCHVLSIYGQEDIASCALDKLKVAWSRFALNCQRFPLLYESVWKGVVSSGAYETGDLMQDFGSTCYNDHHFHASYFIHAAAVIASIDARRGDARWLQDNRGWVDTLVRDAANPSERDPYFPVSRAFDWYNGHSWAKGLFESADGKDEESTSEDVHFAYASQLWGVVSSAPALAARSTVMLAILRRALNAYFYMRADNVNHPAQFSRNRVAGILFENKVDHTTYFGSNIEFIHGIHMLPATPASAYTRDVDWCREEWETWFSKRRVEVVQGGWRGVLYASMIAWDPATAARWFFADNFDWSHLNGGMSLAYYRALAAEAEATSRRR
ncbi:glycoside hydrolase [Auricularia subglabra TFB-10046 SS5]|nr:glycoside hydrolase [Auricularia subglabra TFB-10046 SS5]